MHRYLVLVGRRSRRRLAQAVLLVQGNRLSLPARLGAIGPGEFEPAAHGRQAWMMQLRLVAQAAAAPPPSAGVKTERTAPPAPALRGPASVKYLRPDELDERATPIEVAPLVYPEKAYINRIPGTVRMRIYISSDGRVDRTEIIAASPPDHFERAAIDAVQRTRFHPARKGGRPVPSQKLIEVEFDPYGPTPEQAAQR
ncbi:MAG: energy transducer TonB [Steroidobacteraceae bacterium]